jgi:hypothetical protein
MVPDPPPRVAGDGVRVGESVRPTPSAPIERAQSECARSMGAVEVSLADR